MSKRKASKRSKKRTELFKRPQLLIIGGCAAVLVIALAAIMAFTDQGESFADAAEYSYVTGPALHSGNPNAPVSITLYEDFHCHACAYLNAEVIHDIERRFVETGQAKIFFRHFVHYGQDSLQAAQAAECVHEQDIEFGTDAFRSYHDMLFSNQDNALAPRLVDFARSVGVNDMLAFQKCLNSGKYEDKVTESTQWIQRQGGRGTPTIIIGDRLFTGIPSMETIEQAVSLARQ